MPPHWYCPWDVLGCRALQLLHCTPMFCHILTMLCRMPVSGSKSVVVPRGIASLPHGAMLRWLCVRCLHPVWMCTLLCCCCLHGRDGWAAGLHAAPCVCTAQTYLLGCHAWCCPQGCGWADVPIISTACGLLLLVRSMLLHTCRCSALVLVVLASNHIHQAGTPLCHDAVVGSAIQLFHDEWSLL